MTHFAALIGCDTTEFVRWCDTVHRESQVARALRWARSASMLDVYEAWGEVMLLIWRKSITADTFNDTEHVARWLSSMMATSLRWVWSHEQQRRHKRHGDTRFEVVVMSALERDVLGRELSMLATVPAQEPQLGLSTGWLTDAIDRMTDKQRDALGLLKIASYTRDDAAQLMGCTVQSVRGAARSAVTKIRAAADHAGYPRGTSPQLHTTPHS